MLNTVKLRLSWSIFEELVMRLLLKVENQQYDLLLLITRGGGFPGCQLAELAGIRHVVSAAVMFYGGGDGTRPDQETLVDPIFLEFPADLVLVGKRVLVVDDVWDTGRTISAVKERILLAGGTPVLAVLHYKPTYSQVVGVPDYFVVETDRWIVYPWEPTRNRWRNLRRRFGAEKAFFPAVTMIVR